MGSFAGAGSRRSIAVAPDSRAAIACDPAEPDTFPRIVPSMNTADTVIGAGAITAGGSVSCTFTVNAADFELPLRSTAVQVTVVVVGPGSTKGNRNPDAGAQLTGSGPSTGSLAVATNENSVPDGLVASSVAFAGTVKVGCTASVTTIVTVAVAGSTSVGSVGVKTTESVRVPASSTVPSGGV